jgi:fucose permease
MKFQLAQHPLSTHTFVRTSFTWFAYLMLGYYTYLQASLGPLAPLLRENFHLSYTSTSLPIGTFAVGMILIALCGQQVMRLWQRSMTFWIWTGGAGMALGAIFLLLSQNIMMVVASTFIMGTSGTLLQFTTQAALADQHPERRAVALSEANVVTSLAAGLAPLVIGELQFAGHGWRSTLLIAPGIFVLMILLFHRIIVPGTQAPQATLAVKQEEISSGGRFSPAFWLYWIVLVCSVAMEWCMIIWSAIFLKQAGMSSEIATAIVSIFFIAEVAGRFFGSRLAHYMKTVSLLLLALSIMTLGFLLFWILPDIRLKVIGLFLTGLGVANLFPLTLAVAMDLAPQRAHTASAHLTAGAGISILIAPLLLGKIADTIGIQRAYGLVLALLLITSLLILQANHLARKYMYTG